MQINLIKSVYKSFSKSERKNVFYISLFTFFSILIEIFGLSLIIPITRLFIDIEFYNQLIQKYQFLDIIKDLDKNKIIIYTIGLFIAILITKTILLSILSFSKFNFINRIVKGKTIELFSIYLGQWISFFKSNHTSKLVRNLINEMFVLEAFLNAVIILFSELLFSSVIIFLLMYYDFMIFLYLIIYVIILYFSFKIIFKTRIHDWGIDRQNLQEKITKEITEALGAIKELIIYDKQKIFEDRIKNYHIQKQSLDVKFSTINEIPKYFIELAAVFGYLIISAILYKKGLDKNTLLTTLIFLSVILFKAMPSISRIINSFNQIKFYYPAHELIKNELSLKKNIKRKSDEKIEFNKSLELKSVFFSFDDKIILNNFSIKINKGDKVIILGKSGKGKSTLIDLISGFHNNFEGEFLADNKLIKNFNNWRDKIGYLSQSFFILDDTIRNNIILDEPYNQKRFSHIVDVCNLNVVIDKRGNGLNEKIGERGNMLSGGERQRIGLARALYRNPEILILDEPTSSLDKETADEFISSILKLDENITIIMVTHDKSYSSKFNKKITL